MIWLLISILCLSIATARARRAIADATSALVTAPKSLPFPPALALTASLVASIRLGERLARPQASARRAFRRLLLLAERASAPLSASVASLRGSRKLRRVTLGDVDDVALLSERFHVAQENDFHGPYSETYGRKAITRARLTATVSMR